jgi:hypothetical protein
LFRQPKFGDWNSVIGALRQELAGLAATSWSARKLSA